MLWKTGRGAQILTSTNGTRGKSGHGQWQRDAPIALAYRPDDPEGREHLVIASPVCPVSVFPLLQQILVAPEALLLVAHPAAGRWRQADRLRKTDV